MQSSGTGARMAPQKTVAEALRNGRFSLVYSLRCAKDVAEALRELHGSGQMHGAVRSEAVLLNSTGAELLPAKKPTADMTPAVDIAAFGALLYEMATGMKAAPSATVLLLPFEPAPGEAPIYEGVLRLVSQCLASSSDSRAEMLKVLGELALLSSQADLAVSRPTQNPKPEPATGSTVARQKSGAPRCPKCGGPYVHHSRSRGWFERWLAAWRCPPMRCHQCMHRFLTIGRFRFRKGSPRQEKG